MSTTQQNNGLPLYPVPNNDTHITAAARTISLAFSTDPLSTWLRPNASPRGTFNPAFLKSQERRVEVARVEGRMLQSVSVGALGTHPDSMHHHSDNCSDSGAVVILYPPPEGLSIWMRLRRAWGRARVLLLQIFDRRRGPELDQKRMEQMMKTHDRSLARARGKVPNGQLWYLEVIAVHPDLQGKGMGRATMERILEHAGNEAMVLECTRQENVAFYQKFGFGVIEEVELVSDGLEGKRETVKMWMMLREKSTTSSSTPDK